MTCDECPAAVIQRNGEHPKCTRETRTLLVVYLLMSMLFKNQDSPSEPRVKYPGLRDWLEPSLNFTVKAAMLNGTELTTGQVGSGNKLEFGPV